MNVGHAQLGEVLELFERSSFGAEETGAAQRLGFERLDIGRSQTVGFEVFAGFDRV